MNLFMHSGAYDRDLNISKLERELGIGVNDTKINYYQVSVCTDESGTTIYIGHGLGGFIFSHVGSPTILDILRGKTFEERVFKTIKQAWAKCDKMNADREFIKGIVEKVA